MRQCSAGPCSTVQHCTTAPVGSQPHGTTWHSAGCSPSNTVWSCSLRRHCTVAESATSLSVTYHRHCRPPMPPNRSTARTVRGSCRCSRRPGPARCSRRDWPAKPAVTSTRPSRRSGGSGSPRSRPRRSFCGPGQPSDPASTTPRPAGRGAPNAGSAAGVTMPGRSSRRSCGCAPTFPAPAHRSHWPAARPASRAGCATSGCPATRKWPTCSRYGRWSPPDGPDRRSGGWARFPAAGRPYRRSCCSPAGWPARSSLAHKADPGRRSPRSAKGCPSCMAGAAGSAASSSRWVSRRSAVTFAWSERSRAQAFRVPPVHPPADPDIAEALAELRQLRDMMRSAELERRREPGAWARCAELERVIQERSWRLAGPGHSAPEAGLAEIAAELSASGHLMVSFLARHGRLHALLVHEGTVRLVALGDHGVVEEAATRLLTDLDALAGRSLPAPLEAVIRGSVQRQLDILTDEVIAVMRAELADHDLVIVPTMALSSLPWGLLPDLRGRSVTVSASASAWLSARRSKPPAADRPRSNSAPLLVAGPDLAYAETEIAEIAKVRPGSRLLSGARATVAATLHGLDGAPVAHLAAHGHHERENVLFSRLDLADGPLMAYDIQQLAAAPRQVTLSACDVGRTEVRAGDEILGFTAALLYAGTSSVVSSVARVTHHAAAAVMTGYYRAVAGGAEPARALAAASLADPLAPFVCFGAG